MILLCLLPSEVILTVCYVKMFPRIGENGSVPEQFQEIHSGLPRDTVLKDLLEPSRSVLLEVWRADLLDRRCKVLAHAFDCFSTLFSGCARGKMLYRSAIALTFSFRTRGAVGR